MWSRGKGGSDSVQIVRDLFAAVVVSTSTKNAFLREAKVFLPAKNDLGCRVRANQKSETIVIRKIYTQKKCVKMSSTWVELK